MADTKISALPASSTPLAGTEVLPIVQSSTTVKVSVANLTAGRAVATGALTVTGTMSATTGAAVGGATAGAGGLAFPATAVAVADANTLDDYEEGTWTPACAFGTSGSVTYSTQAGYYRKVGSLVFVECNIIIASVSSPTGNVTVNNLPFTVANQSENIGSLSTGIIRNLVNAKPDIKAYCSSGSTQIIFPVNDTISGSSELQGADLKASTLIYVSGCFITN